jgi:hypothetical protein
MAMQLNQVMNATRTPPFLVPDIIPPNKPAIAQIATMRRFPKGFTIKMLTITRVGRT